MNLVRVIQILQGEDIAPKTKLESAIKYALDHSGGSSGGSNDFDFDVTASFSVSGFAATTTETYANVLAAVNAKKNVMANIDLWGGAFARLPFLFATVVHGEKAKLIFSCIVNTDNGKPGFVQLIFNADGTLEFNISDLALAPEEPEEDEDEGADGA